MMQFYVFGSVMLTVTVQRQERFFSTSVQYDQINIHHAFEAGLCTT